MRTIVCLGLFFMAWAHAETCTVTGSRCLDSTAQKEIYGYVISRDCWQWEETRTCTTGESVDHCTGLASEKGCTQEKEECLSINSSGVCEKTQRTYACDHPVSGLPSDNQALDIRATVSSSFDKTAACATLIQAGCTESAHVCSRASATETVDGIPVTLPCWEEQYTYTCETSPQSLACELLGQAGCTFETTVEVTATTTTKTYRCPVPHSVPEIADIKSLERLTVIDGYESDASACEPFATNPTCSLSRSQCSAVLTEAPDVCQNEARTYTCSGQLDTSVCSPLLEHGCEADALQCQSTLGDTCLAATQDFLCHGELATPLPPAIQERSREVVIDAITPSSTCPTWDTTRGRRAGTCVEVARTCTEDTATKIVAGEPITKDCWHYEVTYRCSGTGESVNGCVAWETDPACEVVRRECLSETDGTCTLETLTYRCQEKPDQIVTQEKCIESVCTLGFCETKDDAPNRNLYDAVLKLEVARQAAVYGDYQDLHFFTGELNRCENKQGHSCCSGQVKGNQSNQAGLGALYVFGVDAATEAIKTVGSPFVYDILASHETLEPIMNALYADAADGAYSPSLSYYGLTVSYSANGLAFSFNPYVFFATIAMEVATDYLSCTPQEQALQLKRGQNLCVYLGSVCTHYNMGSCLVKEERHCCYNSRLARIVQEDAHEQLGLDWGTIDRPACDGLTHHEFLSIDFSRIDLSEFLSDIANTRLASINVERTLKQTDQRIETLKTAEDKYPVATPHRDVCSGNSCPEKGNSP